MLGKDVTVGLDEVTKEDGIIDHHGGVLVKRNCQLLFIAVLDLLGKELLDSGGIHAGGVNDFANLELGPLLEDLYGAVLTFNGDRDAAGRGHDVALLVRFEGSLR